VVPIAIGAAALASTALAAPALGAAAQGSATIVLAEQAKGRTLSGQGVRVQAGAPAGIAGKTLTLPVSAVDPGSQASATADGWLRFRRGERSVKLSELHFNLTGGTLEGRLGRTRIPALRVDAAAVVDSSAGAVSVSQGRLRLTAQLAEALRERLGLQRALVHKGVGTVWLSARANPTMAPAQAVVSGSADWGVLTSWRQYVLGNFGPGSVGTITIGDGATTQGAPASAGSFLTFPAARGSFERGLYGAADKLTLTAGGSVTFAKPGHCIVEVKLAGLKLTIDGANSSIALDSRYDIDTPAGMTCTDQPPVATPGVTFARLDLSGVAPTHSADGRTTTWTAVPAKLTAAGAAAFGAGYPAGQELDPVTISIAVG
jgi:hypothetical protein